MTKRCCRKNDKADTDNKDEAMEDEHDNNNDNIMPMNSDVAWRQDDRLDKNYANDVDISTLHFIKLVSELTYT